MKKSAYTAKDYVERMSSMKPQCKADKTASLNEIKQHYASSDPAAAMTKIGQGFVGPVMMRLKYQGVARNILTEDVVDYGDVPVYDVADEMGLASFIEPYQGEARISQYEGKRVRYGFYHLAEFATIQEQDLMELTVDMAEYAINEAQQRVQEQEDGLLFSQLDLWIDSWTADNPDYYGQTTHVLTEASKNFTPSDFYNTAAKAQLNRLDAHTTVMNPADVFDLYNWDITSTSVNFRDEVFGGTPIQNFAGFHVFKSIMVQQGHAYLMPDSDYVGRFPTRKSLEIRDNPKVENFSLGWVLDEYINVMILNAQGLFRMEKAV